MNKIQTLCVVDDDEIYTFTVKRLVKTTGMAASTLFFENGQYAIDFFKQNTANPAALPELILLDLNMPVLDGWQFIDQFIPLTHLIDKKITIYIVSSSIDEADYKRAKSIKEVKDFIVKPINADTFKQIVMGLEV